MHVTVKTLAKELYAEWNNDDVGRNAAAIAYYTVFSLPAFLLIVLSIAGATLSTTVVNQEVFGTMRLYVGDATVTLLEETLQHIQTTTSTASWISIIGGLLLVFSAMGVIRELQNTMNHIIGIKKPHRTLLEKIWTYALSLLLLLITGIIVIASIVSGTLITIISNKTESFLSIPLDVLTLAHNGISYIALTVMIFCLYLFLPAKRFPLVITFLSSIITSSILVIGTAIASYYVTRTHIGLAYGVAANVLILLFWIYAGANVFLFGVEIMEVAERLHLEEHKKPQGMLKRLLRIK